MDTKETPTFLALPNPVTALRKGFDAVANHVGLILFPLALDLWIWLGPHLQVKTLLNALVRWITETAALDPNYKPGMLDSSLELLATIQERLNVMIFLRTYPVGVPSLMAGSLPLGSPLGSPQMVDVQSGSVVIGWWMVLGVAGLVLGSLYFLLVARVTHPEQLKISETLRHWPKVALQTVFLTLLMVVILFAISAPASCMLTLVAQGGSGLGQTALIVLMVMVMWVAFPLLFAPHGIYAYGDTMMVSLRKSMRVTRLTFPTTSLLFLVVLVASQLLDSLWRVPPEDSWLTIAGLIGHAFLATALLATTFVYYRDADAFVQKMMEKLKG
ncbi:MAG TPA: hypothetical protein PKM21_08010 [Anaerolineales bacterium]|nr:hypothetical protein [Anaerolineales bacterium]